MELSRSEHQRLFHSGPRRSGPRRSKRIPAVQSRETTSNCSPGCRFFDICVSLWLCWFSVKWAQNSDEPIIIQILIHGLAKCLFPANESVQSLMSAKDRLSTRPPPRGSPQESSTSATGTLQGSTLSQGSASVMHSIGYEIETSLKACETQVANTYPKTMIGNGMRLSGQ